MERAVKMFEAMQTPEELQALRKRRRIYWYTSADVVGQGASTTCGICDNTLSPQLAETETPVDDMRQPNVFRSGSLDQRPWCLRPKGQPFAYRYQTNIRTQSPENLSVRTEGEPHRRAQVPARLAVAG